MAADGNFAGKVAVITGAASGIGRALALRAAAEHMKVALADIEPQPLKAALQAVRATGAEAIAVPTDVCDAAAVAALAQQVEDDLGPPWLICNNAGVNKSGATWDFSLEDWRWILGVNLWGVVHGIAAFAPGLVQRNAGHIVNVASAAGLVAIPATAAYVASKHAVVGLSECLYRELQSVRSEVGVTVACPKLVATNIATATRNHPSVAKTPAPISMETLREHAGNAPLNVLAPEELADQIFAATLARRFWLLSHAEELRSSMTARCRQALDGENPDAESTDAIGATLSLLRAGMLG